MNWEFKILDYIEENIQNERWTEAMKLATLIGEKGIFIGICALILGYQKKNRKAAIAIGISLALEVLLGNLILKPMIGRTRPYDIRKKLELLIPKLKDASFPSGHTGATFSAVGALFFSKTKLWIPAALMASSTAFSRMYFYVHYPTDILGGMALGMSSGWMAVKMQKIWGKQKKERTES